MNDENQIKKFQALMSKFHIPQTEIAMMADLYDRFAQALEPFTEDRETAEEGFHQKLNLHYDNLIYVAKTEHVENGGDPKLFLPPISFNDFRRGVISECKKYLRNNPK